MHLAFKNMFLALNEKPSKDPGKKPKNSIQV